MNTRWKGSCALMLATILWTAAQTEAALLTGSLAAPPASVNLTAEGSSDWIHWGLNNASDINRKSTGLSQISDFTTIGSATSVVRLTDSPSKYSWTDGTPAATVTNTPGGVYINNYDGPGRGFLFTVPADLLSRVLKVYVGEFSASGTLQATLSDSSAPAYSQLLTGGTHTVQGVYTINYAAASPGQTLTVRWTETNDLGDADNITLQAAALSVTGTIPEPATFALLSCAAILFSRRRK